MGPLESPFSQVRLHSHPGCQPTAPGGWAVRGGTVDVINSDWLYIGLTIVAFVVMWLLVKGVERFER